MSTSTIGKTAVTGRVIVSSAGTQAEGNSQVRAISADGRYVLFWSEAPNLVANDTNGLADLFLRDRQTITTVRVSVDPAGNQFAGVTHVSAR